MMRSGFVAVAVAVFGLVLAAPAHAQAGKTMSAIGSVVKIAADSIDLDTGKTHLMLTTTEKTMVKVTGGSAKAREAKAEGAKGVKITDAVHEGDQIAVKYTETGGKMIVSEVDVRQRRPQSAQKVK